MSRLMVNRYRDLDLVQALVQALVLALVRVQSWALKELGLRRDQRNPRL